MLMHYTDSPAGSRRYLANVVKVAVRHALLLVGLELLVEQQVELEARLEEAEASEGEGLKRAVRDHPRDARRVRQELLRAHSRRRDALLEPIRLSLRVCLCLSLHVRLRPGRAHSSG